MKRQTLVASPPPSAVPLKGVVVALHRPRRSRTWARLSLWRLGLSRQDHSDRSSRALALHRLMVAEGQRFPELSRSIWHARHDKATRLLARWFEDRQRAGQFRTDTHAEILAAQYISLAVTTPQLRCLVGLGVPLKPAEISKIVDDAVTVFLGGADSRDRTQHA